jgi:hypothetical protein
LCDTVSFFILKLLRQIALQCIGAIASGIMFFFWSRLNDVEKKRVWRLYGWFAGLICAGSIFGIVAECAGIKYAQSLVEVVSSRNLAEEYYWQAELSKWAAVTLVPDSFEVLFISVPLLMVLDRLMHVAFSTSGGLSSRFLLAERAAAVIVVGLNALSISFGAVSSFYSSQEVAIWENIGAAIVSNDTASSAALDAKFYDVTLHTNYFYSISLLCQAASLLFVVLLFAVVFVVCFRRMRQIRQRVIEGSASRQQMPSTDLESDSAGDVVSIVSAVENIPPRFSSHTAQLISNMNSVQLQIVITVIIVFIMLLWMATCLVIDGISVTSQKICNAANEDFSTGTFCNPCENSYALMQDWLLLSPEFTVLGTYVPGQLAMLVALWGMTSKRTLQTMKTQRQSSSAIL